MYIYTNYLDLRVLYVEDQIFNQKIIKELLRKDGITVSLADDGLQGYHKYIVCFSVYIYIYIYRRIQQPLIVFFLIYECLLWTDEK